MTSLEPGGFGDLVDRIGVEVRTTRLRAARAVNTDELLRLVPAGDSLDLADAAGRYGLAGLRARVEPPGNVLPFRRRRSR